MSQTPHFLSFSEIISTGETPEWNKDHNKASTNQSSYKQLTHLTRGVVLEDIHIHPHRFRPKILKVTKREAVRKKVGPLDIFKRSIY